MRRIQSKKHKLGAYEINKISQSCSDDKRYLLDDKIYTLAYFVKTVAQVVIRKKKLKKILIIEKDSGN